MIKFKSLRKKILLNKNAAEFRCFSNKGAEKGLNFLKEVFHPLCPLVKDLRICDLRKLQ